MSQLAELEDDVAATRERLNATIDKIQDRMTLSGMVNEVMGQTGVTGFDAGPGVVQDLLRRFPVPIMIAAAGVGFLIYRSKQRDRRAALAATLAVPVAPTGRARGYDPDQPLGRPRLSALEGREATEA